MGSRGMFRVQGGRWGAQLIQIIGTDGSTRGGTRGPRGTKIDNLKQSAVVANQNYLNFLQLLFRNYLNKTQETEP